MKNPININGKSVSLPDSEGLIGRINREMVDVIPLKSRTCELPFIYLEDNPWGHSQLFALKAIQHLFQSKSEVKV